MTKYPKEFYPLLCEQLDIYLEHNVSKSQKTLMRKLINDKDMSNKVFQKLLKIKNVVIPVIPPKNPNPNIPTPKNLEPITFFLHACIIIHEQSIGIKPLVLNEYKNLNEKISDSSKKIIKIIKRLQKAGIYHPESIHNTLDILENLSLSAEEADKHGPIYIYGHAGMSRKKKEFAKDFFITRFGSLVHEVFGKPLYSAITITAGVVFNRGYQLSVEATKNLLLKFKKQHRPSKKT